MISLSELLLAYLISFTVTLVVCFSYYVFFVRRPLKMLMMALHTSHNDPAVMSQFYIAQGPIKPLARELNAFMQWAGEMQMHEKQRKIRHEIIADISHDFRSPLTSIQGYAETLLEKGQSIPESDFAEYLQIILSNTNVLNQLVNGLLDLAKFDSMCSAPKLEKFSIAEFADEIRRKFKLKAEQKEISFSVSYPRNIPEAYADRLLIERALSNIIENALYYTPSGGEVSVSFERVSRRLQVCVRDTGIGIPPEALPHVFDRFYRVNKDRSKQTGGTGLGLSITKAILDAHESSIKIESILGKGTSITFQLPA